MLFELESTHNAPQVSLFSLTAHVLIHDHSTTQLFVLRSRRSHGKCEWEGMQVMCMEMESHKSRGSVLKGNLQTPHILKPGLTSHDRTDSAADSHVSKYFLNQDKPNMRSHLLEILIVVITLSGVRHTNLLHLEVR